MNQHELAQLNEKNHFKNLYPNKNIFVMMKWHLKWKNFFWHASDDDDW